MAKVTIKCDEKKGSEFGVEVFINGKGEQILSSGESDSFDVTLADVVTLAQVKLQKAKPKKK